MQSENREAVVAPFAGASAANDFFESPAHTEALARLHFLVENRRRLGLLLGGAGSGKTSLLNRFSGELKRQGQCSLNINLFGLDEHEFCWAIAAGLGTNPRTNDPQFQLWRTIVDRFVEHRYQQISSVIVLDDVDEASPTVLTHIVRLVRLDTRPDARTTVVLAANEQRVSCLGRRLLEMSELRIELDPWESNETFDFLQMLLDQSEKDMPQLDEPAKARIHELGNGNPRQVNQLAQMTLLASKGQRVTAIDEEMVESVYRELCAATVD